MPDLTIPRDTFTVLVAGSMNPMVHHPQWYRSIGAIDDNELDESLKDGLSGATPIGSRLQFGSPALTITCQLNLWMVQSTNEGSWERMLSIASLAFAKVHNPSLTAYGLMAQRHIDTDCGVKAILAARVAELKLGFAVGRNPNVNLTLANVEDGFTITTSIQTSVLGDKVVFGLYHYDYPTREIESILDGRFNKFRSDSAKFFSDLLASIKSLDEERDAHE